MVEHATNYQIIWIDSQPENSSMHYFFIFMFASMVVSQEPNPTDLLNHWEAGCNLLNNYKLEVKLSSKTCMSLENGKMTVLPEEKGIPLATKMSTIWRFQDKRRGEFGENNSPEAVMVFDGSAVYDRRPRVRNGQIQNAVGTFGSQEYEDYEANFRTVGGTIDRISLSRDRKSQILTRENGNYVVSFSSSPDGDYKSFGWKVWLDPSKNCLPTKILQFVSFDGVETLDREITNELVEVLPGIWAPMKSRTRLFYKGNDVQFRGRVIQICEIEVLPNFNFMGNNDQTLFAIPFVTGDMIVDRIRNISYRFGYSNPEEYLRGLSNQAQSQVSKLKERNSSQPQIIPTSYLQYAKNIIFWIAVVSALVSSFVFVTKRFFSREKS